MKIGKKTSVALISTIFIFAVLGMKTAYALPSPPFNQCPPVGADSSCAVLIVIDTNGSVVILQDSNMGPFDGIEDTLVGVQDNCASCGTITSLTISGPNILGFDNDGACSGLYTPNPSPSLCQSGMLTTNDPQDYESNNVTFTIVNPNTGSINFSPGLTNGQHAWFSLENSLNATSLKVTPPVGTGVPQFPAGTLLLIGPLALVLVAMLRMRKSRPSTVGLEA
jgi:hypothetical protein